MAKKKTKTKTPKNKKAGRQKIVKVRVSAKKKPKKKDKKTGGFDQAQISEHEIKQAVVYAKDGCRDGTIESLLDWPQRCIAGRPKIEKRLKKARAERAWGIRKNQNKFCKSHPVMAIFLGKNELGQTDKQEHNFNITPVEFNITYDVGDGNS